MTYEEALASEANLKVAKVCRLSLQVGLMTPAARLCFRRALPLRAAGVVFEIQPSCQRSAEGYVYMLSVVYMRTR